MGNKLSLELPKIQIVQGALSGAVSHKWSPHPIGMMEVLLVVMRS
jgi:hypothetical protein